MKKNIFNKFQILFFISVFALAGCTQSGKKVGIGKPFKHNTPLIKTDVKKLGKKEFFFRGKVKIEKNGLPEPPWDPYLGGLGGHFPEKKFEKYFFKKSKYAKISC